MKDMQHLVGILEYYMTHENLESEVWRKQVDETLEKLKQQWEVLTLPMDYPNGIL